MKLEFFGKKQLNFVEFNITGDNYNYDKLQDESLFLKTEVFNLFSHIFEKSNELFDYFEPSKYNARKIIVLRNQLQLNFDQLLKISDVQTLKSFLLDTFLGNQFIDSLYISDHNWEINWETTRNKLSYSTRK